MLTPRITVLVHPIDTGAHPTVPPGWRWAVMVGDGPMSEVGRCVNAGWCPNGGEAALEGEMVGAACTKALRMLGMPAGYARVDLDHDPIPAGGDAIHIGAGG